ncbi:heptosyltransferase family [Nautilia profundicola AmH]|uniref:Heptosyltransferase family n=1 Tax=Nautilia profundicola (strain ATCC BAA-1463 / DSM 18972 / AmH) TaxID=598659 RepID=B9L6Q3_NAUPA|nr:glycosyltransferase family 9 protein [Nautilia profundicola]ACM93569.1 heptosyltransferase family [Nautilia profundicola AmH]
MITKIKIFIKYILFNIIDKLIRKNSKVKEKTILLIRLDAIGDYVLFRNFIEVLKNEYKNYKITLVGNVAWKAIAEEFDSEFIDKFIGIDRVKFGKNIVYRYKKLKEITKQDYEIVINPIYSRTFLFDDNIVKVVNAKEKIGSNGDLSNIRKWQKNISDKYYTKLLPAKNEIMFEFYRNKEFFENLLNKKIDIKRPIIKLKEKILSFKLPNNYAILFIGASADFRKWSIENFVEIGKYLKDKYNYEIVVCGGPTDIEEAKKFKNLANYDYIDMVGKTSLIDFLYIIYNGNLMIANETSAPHFAVALEMTNIFVISNGNHFGRFTPYPKEIWPYYYPIYHPEIEKDLDNYKKLSNSYGYGSKLNINNISVEKVKNRISEVLDDENS